MTFKGMLTILVNDYKKQYEEKIFSVADELIRTRRELREVKEQLHNLQSKRTSSSSDILNISVPKINLRVQYNEVFNELCDFNQTMSIKDLLVKLRQITGIPYDHPIRLRVLSEDSLTTLFYLDKELDCTLESYGNDLKSQMILYIEDNNEITSKQIHPLQQRKIITNNEQKYSYESDV